MALLSFSIKIQFRFLLRAADIIAASLDITPERVKKNRKEHKARLMKY